MPSGMWKAGGAHKSHAAPSHTGHAPRPASKASQTVKQQPRRGRVATRAARGHSSSVAVPIGGRAQLVSRLRRSGRMICVRARTSSVHKEACNGGKGFEPWLTCHLPSKSAPVCWTRFRPSQALERSPGGRARPTCSKRAHHTPRGTALPALSSSAQQLSRRRLRRSDVLLRRADGGWR